MLYCYEIHTTYFLLGVFVVVPADIADPSVKHLLTVNICTDPLVNTCRLKQKPSVQQIFLNTRCYEETNTSLRLGQYLERWIVFTLEVAYFPTNEKFCCCGDSTCTAAASHKMFCAFSCHRVHGLYDFARSTTTWCRISRRLPLARPRSFILWTVAARPRVYLLFAWFSTCCVVRRISEESEKLSYEERRDYDYCWVVDPLDGTKVRFPLFLFATSGACVPPLPC